jgi:hypothetical protein
VEDIIPNIALRAIIEWYIRQLMASGKVEEKEIVYCREED